jgi:arylsulfatase A-like enzyme
MVASRTPEPGRVEHVGSDVQREVLPIPDRRQIGLTTYDAKDPDTSYLPITRLRPPAGAPNVLVVLIDDVGFGASSAFGGPVNMPTAERLAAGGLKYTRFHTTALCSPTRAAMLSGRNHHAVGMGSITETAISAPGYTGVRPNTCAPLAETLKLNGYATAHIGKCHEVPAWETSPAGPFDRWPTGNGFQHFYGFIAGETNQWYPALHEDHTPVAPWGTPEQGYHLMPDLMPDLADKAIGWVRQQQALTPDQPFFCYFAPGATHAPHHVPKEWADRYKGRFDQGWDALRKETFACQQQLGVIPADAELTRRHEEIPAWEDMEEELRPVLARQMEVYAGFLEYADHHIGRLIDALAALEVLDDTLVYLIIGDNGASAEATLQGTLNEIALAEAPGLETPEFLAANIDKLSTPEAYNHYAVGGAHAMCTPYQWTKQVASHWGGTRNATIVHWPTGIQAKGDVRHQFCHVIDVAPTVLEVAGLPEPVQVHGAGVPFDQDVWELYDGTGDWTQAHDLAATQHPPGPDGVRLRRRRARQGRHRHPLCRRRPGRLHPRGADPRPQLLPGRDHRRRPRHRRPRLRRLRGRRQRLHRTDQLGPPRHRHRQPRPPHRPSPPPPLRHDPAVRRTYG